MLQLVQLNKSQQKVYERLVSLPARSTVTVRCEREHLANGRMHEVIKIMGGVDRGHYDEVCTTCGHVDNRSIATAFNAYEAYVRGQATRA